MTQIHDFCHGFILRHKHDLKEYDYCQTCGAFTYNIDGDFPTGTDKKANKAAWDNGLNQSPKEKEEKK